MTLPTRRFPALLTATLLLAPLTAHSAAVYWGFQNSPDTGTTARVTYNSISGFTGNPTITFIPGTGGAGNSSGGGGVTFRDPNTGIDYIGDNTANAMIGSNYGINASSTPGTGGAIPSLTGAGFSVSLNTTNLTDLALRFDIRTATSSNSVRGRVGAVTSISAFNYRTSPGGAWQTVGISDFSAWNWVVDGAWTNEVSLNLASYDFLENQANLELQFIFNGGEKVAITEGGSNYAVQNYRIDNLLITAVPEPATSALLALGAPGLLRRRRRH